MDVGGEDKAGGCRRTRDVTNGIIRLKPVASDGKPLSLETYISPVVTNLSLRDHWGRRGTQRSRLAAKFGSLTPGPLLRSEYNSCNFFRERFFAGTPLRRNASSQNASSQERLFAGTPLRRNASPQERLFAGTPLRRTPLRSNMLVTEYHSKTATGSASTGEGFRPDSPLYTGAIGHESWAQHPVDMRNLIHNRSRSSSSNASGNENVGSESGGM
ncbi:hypothetical protein F5877DRAFT_73187 [Lentinula edodes]|nr:hypothetical protein F5877DRAFT_73187 [Lentinula edodes]